MTRFEPGSSGIISDCSANCATTTSLAIFFTKGIISRPSLSSVWPDLFISIGLWQLLEGLFSIRRNFYPTHLILKVYLGNFHR